MTKTTRPAFDVRPLLTGAGFIDSAPLLREPVASKTAAIRACRRAGYRVLTVGGMVEVALDHITPDGIEVHTWHVTVHPTR